MRHYKATISSEYGEEIRTMKIKARNGIEALKVANMVTGKRQAVHLAEEIHCMCTTEIIALVVLAVFVILGAVWLI